MLSASTFYTPDEAVIRSKVSSSQQEQKLPDSQLDTVYEIQRCVDWIKEFGYKQVSRILLSCQPRVAMTSCFVYKVFRDLDLIDHLCINPIRRIGLIHK